MAKIVPHLWFDHEAVEAAEFYVAVFGGDSKVTNVNTLHGTPSGDAEFVAFELAGQSFEAINGGPLFHFNSSISFTVYCTTTDEVDQLWARLSECGNILMNLGEYPFSPHYGWLSDRYGLSWQVTMAEQFSQKIVPSLMFSDDIYGKGNEALELYQSVFSNASLQSVLFVEEDEGHDVAGTVRHARFSVAGYEFVLIESGHPHGFTFTEAISFMVYCTDQQEIDYYWDKLSAVPAAEQCGWLKDRYGLSWQIIPVQMDEMMRSHDRMALDRVTKAFLPMKKLDLATLLKAYKG